jgi:hypothetical protein
MSNPYTDALAQSNIQNTGITGLMLRDFINQAQPTSQADALAKLENYSANPGARGFIQRQLSAPEYTLEGIQSLNQTRADREADYARKAEKGFFNTGDYTVFSDKPLWDTYGFMTPGAEYVRMGQFNAKNLPFSSPGVGIANTGVTSENIFPTLQNLYNQYGQYEDAGFEGGNKMGGNKSNWGALKSFATGDRGEFQSAINAPYGSVDALKTYLDTGEITKDFNPEFALQAYDYAQRETARQQQRKKGSFLQQAGGIFADYIAPAMVAFGGPYAKAVGLAAQAGAGAARGQSFGDIVANTGQSYLMSGMPVGDLTSAQVAAINAGITGARGGDLGDVARTGVGTYFGREGADAVAAAKAKNIKDGISNFSGEGIGNILKSGTSSELKNIGTNILLDTIDPIEGQSVAESAATDSYTTDTGSGTIGIDSAGNPVTVGGQETYQSVGPDVYQGIGALGSSFKNIYERGLA